jgi:hypothetical protein
VAADTGNWGVTATTPVEWLYVAVTENYATPGALASGPVVNDTVTGNARPVRQGKARGRDSGQNPTAPPAG